MRRRRPRRRRPRRRRLPAGRVGRDAAARARGRQAGAAAHPPRRPRRRARALRVRDRGGARAVPDAARRPVGRPEGGARGPLGRAAARAARGARGGRRRPVPGRPRDRQADRRADHRRAAREGRRGAAPSDAIAVDPRATTRGRWPATACSASATPPARPTQLLDGADGRHARGSDRARAAGRPADEPVRSPTPTARRPERAPPEDDLDRSLRPRRLDDFVGQEALKDQLAVSIEAAASRGEALDHVLFAGPPGLGKTSLAQIVAAELDVPFVQTAGPALERKGDVAAFLTALEPRSVFFVDEIHRLPRALEETFYPAMEDGCLPITVGQGAGARVVTLDAAAVHADRRDDPRRAAHHAAARPLRDPAPPRALRRRRPRATIVRRSARLLDVAIEDGGAVAIADRSRGTPRVANRLLKRVRDYAEVRGTGVVTGEMADRGARPARRRPRGSRPARPRDPRARSARSSAAARLACRRSPSPWGRSRTRSRTCTSRTCSSAA